MVLEKIIREQPLRAVLIAAAIALVFGGVLMYLWLNGFSTTALVSSVGGTIGGKGVRLQQSEYPLVNPLLLCDLGPQSDAIQNKVLETKLQQFVASRSKGDKEDSMSVYIQRYGSGWVGVNENELYAPASLTKVPLMLAYYDLAESSPEILEEQISYNGDDQNVGEYFQSPSHIMQGRTYTVEELIESMIEHSDNTATVLLQQSVPANALTNVFTNIGLPPPPMDPATEYLSVKSYAYFFRLLYNATYLSRGYSQKALDLLTQTDFTKGIRAGVPQGTTVAEKFGERTVVGVDGSVERRELHDCGIVYKKGAPYILCVMSRGSSFETLSKNIADVSKLVYDNITPVINKN